MAPARNGKRWRDGSRKDSNSGSVIHRLSEAGEKQAQIDRLIRHAEKAWIVSTFVSHIGQQGHVPCIELANPDGTRKLGVELDAVQFHAGLQAFQDIGHELAFAILEFLVEHLTTIFQHGVQFLCAPPCWSVVDALELDGGTTCSFVKRKSSRPCIASTAADELMPVLVVELDVLDVFDVLNVLDELELDAEFAREESSAERSAWMAIFVCEPISSTSVTLRSPASATTRLGSRK